MKRQYPGTDAGNAEFFASRYKDRVRFDHRRRLWFVWREHWWAPDSNGEVRRLAKEAARSRLAAAVKIPGDIKRKEAVKWGMQSESRYRLDAAIAMAQVEPPLADAGTHWNIDPWRLGVANGVVDLRTGRLRKGRQSDRITFHSDIPFALKAECPRWLQFLDEVFDADKELIEYVQRAVGYSLTGDRREQCLFLCWGEGANGKSTFLEVLRDVLGDYAHNLPFSAFEMKARASIPNDVASIVGRRLVTAVETDESTRLNEARVKALTGSDPVTARFLYGEFFDFHPVAKFWLAFNHKPLVSDDSHGFWRRVRLIPFEHVFQGKEEDKRLIEKLKAEADGILPWAVDGALKWQKQGLGAPPAVKKATEEYREESDPLNEFIDECCVVESDAQVAAAELWAAYQRWSEDNGARSPIDRAKFSQRLAGRGFEKEREGHDRTWIWLGIRCLEEASTADERIIADVLS